MYCEIKATWLDSLKTKFKSERSKLGFEQSVRDHKKLATKRAAKQPVIEGDEIATKKIQRSKTSCYCYIPVSTVCSMLILYILHTYLNLYFVHEAFKAIPIVLFLGCGV